MGNPTTMYFFSLDNNDGENMDWFIEAKTLNEAMTLYLEHLEEECEESRTTLPDLKVFVVPGNQGFSRVVDWYTDVECVYPEGDKQ